MIGASRDVVVPQGTFESGDIYAVVLRCGCGDPDSHSKLGLPCPSPRAREDNGLIAHVDGSEIREFVGEEEVPFRTLLWDFIKAVGVWIQSEWRRRR